MSAFPIVFIHRGRCSYLPCSLIQARQSNPTAQLCLLGDQANVGLLQATHLSWTDYAQRAERFAAVYQHRSTNSHAYELFCFQRWFVLCEFLARHNHEKCLYLDSDVLLFADAACESQEFSGFDFTPSQDSPHCMFIQRREALEQFCAFLLECYTEPALCRELEEVFLVLQASGRHGGACDMTAFALYRRLGKARFMDYYGVQGDKVFDHSMCDGQGGFEMESGIKKVHWLRGQPLVRHLPSGRLLPFRTLHFQGPSKGRIFAHVRTGSLPLWLCYSLNRLLAKKAKLFP